MPKQPSLVERFLQESRWLGVGVLTALLTAALWSYNRDDPAWTHATLTPTTNALGRPGAVTADVLLFVFGLSAWWIIVLLLFFAWRGLTHWPLLQRIVIRRPLPAAALGFSLLLVASTALESLRFHSYGSRLPYLPGGVLGSTLAHAVQEPLGYTAATLLFLLLLLVGWQMFTGMSWLLTIERVGAFIENTVGFYVKVFERWQDRRIGREIAHQRDENLKLEKQKFAEQQPLYIATPPPPADFAPKVVRQLAAEQAAHDKAAKASRQMSLFAAETVQKPELLSLAVPEPLGADQVAMMSSAEANQTPPIRQTDAPNLDPASPLGSAALIAADPDDGLEATEPVAAATTVDQVPYDAPIKLQPAPACDLDYVSLASTRPRFTAFDMGLLPSTAEAAKSSSDVSFVPEPDLADSGPQAEPLLRAASVKAEPAAAPSHTTITGSLLLSQSATQTARLATAPLPPISLLDPPVAVNELPSHETIEFTSRLIERKLAEFRVEVRVISAYPGPVVTRYEIEPAVGVKGSQIINLERDLARALALVSVRIVDTVPGKTCMAFELPNSKRQTVKLIEIMASRAYQESSSLLTICLGKDISGQPTVADLAKMPHLLVAGTTGSGKSVGVNAMILSLLYKATPEQVRLIMIDPKMLEFSTYQDIPHLLSPVVTDMKQAASALTWCVGEMERRYRLMSALGVRNIGGYNEKLRQARQHGKPIGNPFSLTPEAPEPLLAMPFIVVVIDELADLMMVVGKKIEELIARLTQKARAAGIHLILATQRPSVDVITGLIKANVPTRLSFQVSTKIDSRTILDQQGAETLLGQGDMLYLSPGSGYPTRVHGAYVSDDEVHRVAAFLKETGEPDYVDGILSGGEVETEAGGESDDPGLSEKDPLYDRAVEIVVESKRASVSLVQRNLRIGYNRASRMVEAMEVAGIVSRADERGSREVLSKKSE